MAFFAVFAYVFAAPELERNAEFANLTQGLVGSVNPLSSVASKDSLGAPASPDVLQAPSGSASLKNLIPSGPGRFHSIRNITGNISNLTVLKFTVLTATVAKILSNAAAGIVIVRPTLQEL